MRLSIRESEREKRKIVENEDSVSFQTTKFKFTVREERESLYLKSDS